MKFFYRNTVVVKRHRTSLRRRFKGRQKHRSLIISLFTADPGRHC